MFSSREICLWNNRCHFYTVEVNHILKNQQSKAEERRPTSCLVWPCKCLWISPTWAHSRRTRPLLHPNGYEGHITSYLGGSVHKQLAGPAEGDPNRVRHLAHPVCHGYEPPHLSNRTCNCWSVGDGFRPACATRVHGRHHNLCV